jgi:hypothetical protein
MRKILHILTREQDDLAQAIVADHQKNPAVQVQTVDLTAPNPDYAELVRKIFESDSVQVW